MPTPPTTKSQLTSITLPIYQSKKNTEFKNIKIKNIKVKNIKVKNIKVNKNKGFSLLEMILSMGIIAVLFEILTPYYTITIAKAQAYQAISILNASRGFIASYYYENGDFPNAKEFKEFLPQSFAGFSAKSKASGSIVGNQYLSDITVHRIQKGFSFNQQVNFYVVGHFKNQNISTHLKNQALIMGTDNQTNASLWNCYKTNSIPDGAVPKVCNESLPLDVSKQAHLISI